MDSFRAPFYFINSLLIPDRHLYRTYLFYSKVWCVHEQATPAPEYASRGQDQHTHGRFEVSGLMSALRVTSICEVQECACKKPPANGHVYMPCELVYMLAIFSPEEAANRETTGERMKIREYRKLEKWAGHFLHRKSDARGWGNSILYDTSHWRDIRTVTLSAGKWQLRAAVRVLGTVSSVHEDYFTKEGARIAPSVHDDGTYVVLQFTDPMNMGFWERVGTQWRLMTFDDVMHLRTNMVSQLTQGERHLSERV